MSANPSPRPARSDESLGRLGPQEQEIATRLRAHERATPLPPRWAEVQISVGNQHTTIEVECHGKTLPSFRGSRETPAEPGGFALEYVEYCGRDITPLFTEDQLAKLAEDA